MLRKDKSEEQSPKSHPIPIIATGEITEIDLFDYKKEVVIADSQRGLITELTADQNIKSLQDESIIKQPNVAANAPDKLLAIVKLFNQLVKSDEADRKLSAAYVPASVSLRTDTLRVGKDEVALVVRNKIPELLPHSKYYYVPNNLLNPSIDIHKIDIYTLNSKFFGAYGVYVMIVPPGQYGLLNHDNDYFVYDEGIHVFRAKGINAGLVATETYKEEIIDADSIKFQEKNKEHITFGNLHIISPQPATLFPITIDDKDYLLPRQTEPYIFRSNQFKKSKSHFYEIQSYVIHQSLQRFKPTLDMVTVINFNGVIRFLGPDSKDLRPRYLRGLENIYIGYISTSLQKAQLPRPSLKEVNNNTSNVSDIIESEQPAFESFPIANSKLSLGIHLNVDYCITDPAKLFLNLFGNVKEIILNLDEQIHNKLGEVCFEGLRRIIEHHPLKNDEKKDSKDTIILDTDTNAIKTEFINRIIPKISAMFGVEFTSVQLKFNATEHKKRDTKTLVITPTSYLKFEGNRSPTMFGNNLQSNTPKPKIANSNDQEDRQNRSPRH